MTWLDEARARCAAATKGPWRVEEVVEVWGQTPVAITSLVKSVAERADAMFIAHARTDLPRALALIEEMAAALYAANDWLCSIQMDDGYAQGKHAAFEKVKAALAKLREP